MLPLSLVLVVLATRPAHAVVPGLLGPLAILLELIPQLIALLLGLLGSALSLSYWRQNLRRYARPLILLCTLALGFLGGILWFARDRRSSLVAQPSPTPSGQVVHPVRDWLSFRGNQDGSGLGCTDPLPIGGPPQVQWIHSDPDRSTYISSPTVVADRVYIGAAKVARPPFGGSIECFDAHTGKLVWRFITSDPVFSSPVISGDDLYCGEGLHENKASKLYCIDRHTGKVRYAVATHGHVEAPPTVAGEALLFSAGGDGLYKIERATGKILWRAPCGHCDSAPAFDGERVYAGTAYGTDAVVCIDFKSGKTVWRKPQDLPVWGHAAVRQGRVYVGLGNGTFGGSHARPQGALLCLDSGSGGPVWRTAFPDSINTSLALDGPHLLLGCHDGNAYCVNQQDGAIVWKSNVGRPLLSSLVIQGEVVLAAGGDGWLHALTRAKGEPRWDCVLATEGCESSPLLSGGRVFIGAGSSVLCLGR